MELQGGHSVLAAERTTTLLKGRVLRTAQILFTRCSALRLNLSKIITNGNNMSIMQKNGIAINIEHVKNMMARNLARPTSSLLRSRGPSLPT